MFPMTFTIHTLEQYRRVINVLLPDGIESVYNVPAQAEVAENTASSTPKSFPFLPAEAAAHEDPAAVEVPSHTETVAASVPAEPQEEPLQSEYSAPHASHADASAAILALCKAGRKAAAVSILARFGGATKLTQVQPKDYAALIAACEAANA